jgi:hypothetical protein
VARQVDARHPRRKRNQLAQGGRRGIGKQLGPADIESFSLDRFFEWGATVDLQPARNGGRSEASPPRQLPHAQPRRSQALDSQNALSPGQLAAVEWVEGSIVKLRQHDERYRNRWG